VPAEAPHVATGVHVEKGPRAPPDLVDVVDLPGRVVQELGRLHPDHDDEFDLPVDAGRRQGDLAEGTGQRGQVLREDGRSLGRLHPPFGGVRGVVETDGEDLAGRRGRGAQEARVERRRPVVVEVSGPRSEGRPIVEHRRR